ncbi:MAG: rhamnogalacturonan acetylesterase [Candidatus Pseudobacter hemicellulosilyticus]|uniref:Rhamnogalacturonan acetylesterase n=1 Tax=Candidatus Pseudobacter hemicellulosilyticus TaxID=3121375 RepID=A0AAJ5WW23_9BACT|nr:MAG: rhamnogalacturonan acetylesterase [Pseudobacter sp.]
MKTLRLSYFLVPLCCLLAFALPPRKKIRIWMIGDSTMSIKSMRAAPETGWGMPFVAFWDSTVRVENRALNGRSTRTFIGEQHWQAVADSLQADDYVLMQFGHNDEAKGPRYAERSASVPDYTLNLTRFIKETRQKNAHPVLITPVTRLRFDSTGKAQLTHTGYREAVMELGRQLQVPVIDLDSLSRGLLEKYGPEQSKLLYLQLDSLQHPNYPAGIKDGTHFSELGARRMAELVLAEIRRQQLPLAERIVVPPAKK